MRPLRAARAAAQAHARPALLVLRDRTLTGRGRRAQAKGPPNPGEFSPESGRRGAGSRAVAAPAVGGTRQLGGRPAGRGAVAATACLQRGCRQQDGREWRRRRVGGWLPAIPLPSTQAQPSRPAIGGPPAPGGHV